MYLQVCEAYRLSLNVQPGSCSHDVVDWVVRILVACVHVVRPANKINPWIKIIIVIV